MNPVDRRRLAAPDLARDADAARPRDARSSSVGRGAPRCHAARGRRPRAAHRRADPERACCARSPPSCPRSPSPRSCATTTASRAGTSTSTRGFYPLGSCTMKHNPRLNERVAALPGHARLHPAQDPRRAQGALELMWLLQRLAVGDLRPAARQPPALGRLPRRARRPAADPRVPRRPRRAADQGPDPRHRPRHQPGDGDDGRLRGRQGRDQRARRGRPRRPARQGRRPGRLPDADQPQHARPVRREHRRDRRDRPRASAAPSTTTAPT